MAQYPEPPARRRSRRCGPRSARYGWCSPEAIDQVAAVMRRDARPTSTAVATFYDMLDTEPGRARTTSTSARTSPARCAAPTSCSTRFDEARRATTRRRRRARASSASAPATSRRWPRSTARYVGPLDAGRRAGSCSTQLRAGRGGRCPRSSWTRAPPERRPATPAGGAASMTEHPALQATSTSPACATIDVYERLRRLRGAAQGAAGDGARARCSRSSRTSGLRGRGGAGFSMGKKASLPARRATWTSTSAATPTSPSPAPSRTAS